MRSLCANINQIKTLLNNCDPPVIVLSETRITSDISDNEIKLKNYKVYRIDSDSRRTGGVAIFIRNEILVCDVKRKFMNKNYWLIAVQIKYANWYGIVVGVYHSPSSDDNEFALHFLQWLNEINESSQNMFVCGDFNINWLNANPIQRMIAEGTNDIGLSQIIHSPTRITETSSTLIDLCFCNDKSIKASIKSKFNISDHECLAFSVDKKESYKERFKQISILKDYNPEKFRNELRKINWNENMECDLIQKSCTFVQNIKNVLKVFIAQKNIPMANDCKWFNCELKKLKIERNTAYEKAKFTNDLNDWVIYKSLRNLYVSKLRKAESDFIKNIVSENNGDQKKMWRTLKDLMGMKQTSGINALKIDNDIVNEKPIIADQLNKFFIKSIDEINKSIGEPNDQCQMNLINVQSTFKFKNVSYDEIKKAINQIKSNSDPNFIKPSILLDGLPVFGGKMGEIINESFTTGTFPDWKCSIITPIQKVNGTINPEELRPINCLPAYEKVLEILAKQQLDDYLNDNKILAQQQSGFRKFHSCETALNRVFYEWKSELENGNFLICIFLDLKRAFETIDRKILIEKLERIGIKNIEKKWFTDYLTNRTQKTKIDNYLSAEINNEIGVPQGTVLASILFSIYINDICEIFNDENNVCLNLFADDTEIHLATKNINEGIQKMNNVLKKINKYLKVNKLKLNVNKTKCLIIRNKRSIVPSNINSLVIENEEIEIVSKVKYLGITIDNELNLNEHVNYLCKKASSKVGVLNRVKNKVKTEERITIYKTIIAPHFEYCPSILFLLSDNQIKRIQKIQNKAMRAVMRVNKRTSIQLMLETLNWMSVKQTIFMRTFNFIRKMISGNSPEYLKSMISTNSENHNLNLRSNNNLSLKNFTRGNTQNSLVYKGFKIYNTIPNEIKNERSDMIFNRKIKEWTKSNVPL